MDRGVWEGSPSDNTAPEKRARGRPRKEKGRKGRPFGSRKKAESDEEWEGSPAARSRRLKRPAKEDGDGLDGADLKKMVEKPKRGRPSKPANVKKPAKKSSDEDEMNSDGGEGEKHVPKSKKVVERERPLKKADVQLETDDEESDNGENKKEAEARKAKKPKKSVPDEEVVDTKTYCFCGGVGYGLMIQCDNPVCVEQWFHNTCFGFKYDEEPKTEQWFCSAACREEEKSGSSSGTQKKQEPKAEGWKYSF